MFKSFVDSTEIKFGEGLTGVVGPNGCGKSNIVDAVKWVLGESRVTELRSGQSKDVIFNGSGNRGPAGRASVELVFDNSILPKTQILPKTHQIKDAYECLNMGRYSVAWGCIGIAIDCY